MSQEANVVDVDEDVEVATPQEINAVDVALADLENHAEDLLQHVSHLKLLKENGHFKYLSKASRNRLMEEMVNKAGIVEDMTKVAFRLLKKIKREKPTEEVVDALIGANGRPDGLTIVHNFPLHRPQS